ncbi:MAG: hypothetical protein HQM10_26505 [Candidatus Riflebacteria bacterium]|nr:hypothetical protein [Candidatus Riflebacteria bacterium]
MAGKKSFPAKIRSRPYQCPAGKRAVETFSPRQILLKVCREFSKSPGEVRSWDYEDYKSALDSITETPGIADLVYGFYKKPEKKEGLPLTTKEDRIKFLDSLEKK